MAGGHVDDEALTLASDHPVKGLGHDLVVVALDELWPDLLDERHEVALGGSPVLDRVEPIQNSKYLPLLANR